MEKCSPRGAPQKRDGESREEPEEHKRKEVELVESVDELRTSSSIRNIQCRILQYLMRGLLQR